MGRINKYLFYALALFPILDFALLNIITILFIITIPYDSQLFSITPKKKVLFIITLFLLTLLPLFRDSFQCSITYWTEKVLPIYLITFLSLFAAPYITNNDYIKFKTFYVIGSILYILKFILIVFVNIYNGKLEILFKKNFLFYSDIIHLIGTEIDDLTTYYHKPYFSLIILLALFFVTENFLERKHQKLNLFLILFFLICIILPLSLPNIFLTFIYLIFFIFKLLRKKRVVLSMTLFLSITSLVLFFIYKSFEINNLDVKEDVGFVVELIKGKHQESALNQSTPREIIYSSLIEKINEVPLLGYGYCKGKETVTHIVEESISKSIDDITSTRNLLVNTDSMESQLWMKNGLKVEHVDSLFSITPIFNNCKAHTLFQIVDGLNRGEFYTFSLSIKPVKGNVVIRLGELNNQMAIFDINNEKFIYIGKDINNTFIRHEGNGFIKIGITTKIKTNKNIALIGFLSKDNQYNHCFEEGVYMKIKQPQLEEGIRLTTYNKGLSKNERNIVGSKINAHNIFIQEYYLGGLLGLISIIILYGWLLYLGKTTGNLLMFSYVLALIFNSLFENIQYRQIGISILIITSVLLIFKRKL